MNRKAILPLFIFFLSWVVIEFLRFGFVARGDEGHIATFTESLFRFVQMAIAGGGTHIAIDLYGLRDQENQHWRNLKTESFRAFGVILLASIVIYFGALVTSTFPVFLAAFFAISVAGLLVYQSAGRILSAYSRIKETQDVRCTCRSCASEKRKLQDDID